MYVMAKVIRESENRHAALSLAREEWDQNKLLAELSCRAAFEIDCILERLKGSRIADRKRYAITARLNDVERERNRRFRMLWALLHSVLAPLPNEHPLFHESPDLEQPRWFIPFHRYQEISRKEKSWTFCLGYGRWADRPNPEARARRHRFLNIRMRFMDSRPPYSCEYGIRFPPLLFTDQNQQYIVLGPTEWHRSLITAGKFGRTPIDLNFNKLTADIENGLS